MLALAFAGCKKHETSEKENGGKPPVEEPPVKYETVNIGGTEWMLYNLANPRQAEGGATFATKLPSECTGTRLESHGKLYQWGVNVAWSSMGESINGATPDGKWNTSEWPSDWTDQPCPKGYRLPTNEEFENLYNNTTVSNGGGWSEDDYGYKAFTSKDDNSKSIEFPAVGLRDDQLSGSLSDAGTMGLYWSSVVFNIGYANTHNFAFNNDEIFPYSFSGKRHGQSIRCVKGNTGTNDPDDPDNPGTEPPVKYETVNMGSTEWMLYNLANPKQAVGGATFATKLPSECRGIRLESHGKFYQWGINVAWDTTGDDATGATPPGSWNTSTYPSSWTEQPCPKGYRLPTFDDFKSLANNSTIRMEGGQTKDDYGYRVFTCRDDPSKRLELPAVGYRDDSDGSLLKPGEKGGYWTSVMTGLEGAHTHFFPIRDNGLYQQAFYKRYGFSVRCVKGSPDRISVDPFSTIKIGDTEWMPLNLANPRQARGGATFATKLPSQCTGTRLESHGYFYQWGVNEAWDTIGEFVSSWPSSENRTGPSSWPVHPCPGGYRLPTKEEFENLYNNSAVTNGGGWSLDDYGYKIFTSNSDPSKRLEFPAVGHRFHYGDGKLFYNGEQGNYWLSDSQSYTSAYYLSFSNSKWGVYSNYKQSGYNIRCVKGNTADTDPNPVNPDIKIDPLSTIEIDGIEWTPLNLANPRQAPGGATFATKLPSQCSGIRAESHGKFYQWGINVAWNTTGKSATGAIPSGSWSTTTPYSWTEQPCPEGYRLPIKEEFQSLYNNSTVLNGGAWAEDDYGYKIFISKNNPSKRLEFPAADSRLPNDGSLSDAIGKAGYYWSSNSSMAFKNNNVYLDLNNILRRGFNVRCVKGSTDDSYNPDKKIDPFSTIEIGGTEWMPLNLANPRQAEGGATFATKLPSQCTDIRAESHGKFYQWGINVAWTTTDPKSSTPSGASWNTSPYPSNWNTHPCPTGYRLPTKDEFQNLINSCTVTRGGGWSSSDYGYIKFTSGSNSVKFPAVGYRVDYSSGTLRGAGTNGYYWSSVAYTSGTSSLSAYVLYFNSSSLNVDRNNTNKGYGYSVRCVRQ